MNIPDQQEAGKDVQTDYKAKTLRIKVVENAKEGRPTVNVKVPIGLVKWVMKMGQASSPQLKDADLDWDSIDAMIEHGDLGKIVEIEDDSQHKTVEVWVE